MENLNAEREQITSSNNDLYKYVRRIIESVEYKGNLDHDDVPTILREFARGYEQRIKELAEERDGFENLAHTAIETQNRMSDTIEELAEENERLRADCAKGANALIEEMQKNRTIEADTLKKLREKSHKFFDAVFDQIAKEMLEGE